MGQDSAAQAASTLRDYIAVLRQRKWIVIQAVVLVPVAAVLYSLHQTHQYRATAQVLINEQNPALTLAGGGTATNLQPDRAVDTQAKVAEAPEIARRTLAALHITNLPLRVFMRASTVTTQKNQDILAFTVTDSRYRRTSLLATTLAREYIRYRRALDTAALLRARTEVRARLQTLTRQHQQGTTTWADLMHNLQQLSVAAALQTSNASLVAAAGPATQVQPRPRRNALLGLMLGLVLGVALAFLRETLDTRIRSSEILERELEMPLLARIPAPPRLLWKANKLVMDIQPDSLEAEPFRVLRTNFDFFNMEHGARTVMVTSAIGAEGKSTTVANLAIALARTGKRVALVDLDLRRPFLHRFFELEEDAPGVTDIALGHAHLEPHGHSEVGDEAGSLDVLIAGSPTNDPGELVGSKRLDELLERLKERADIVLVDAPPLLVVSDAIALTAKVDAIILITRLGAIRRPMLAELRRILASCPTRALGFVVTGAEVEQDGYGYPARYGYGSRYYGKARR